MLPYVSLQQLFKAKALVFNKENTKTLVLLACYEGMTIHEE